MNVYKSVGHTVGTPEALALSERLSVWHDSMVAHERPPDSSRVTLCDDECPHAEAKTLWRHAVEIFGDNAGRFVFLRRHGFHDILGPHGLEEAAAHGVTGFPPG